MSSTDLLSSYINIFIAINQQMSYARLELCCKNRKVTVIPRKTVDSDILKQDINTPQFDRLERRPATRAEEANVETKKQKNTAAKANIEAEKSTH